MRQKKEGIAGVSGDVAIKNRVQTPSPAPVSNPFAVTNQLKKLGRNLLYSYQSKTVMLGQKRPKSFRVVRLACTQILPQVIRTDTRRHGRWCW